MRWVSYSCTKNIKYRVDEDAEGLGSRISEAVVSVSRPPIINLGEISATDTRTLTSSAAKITQTKTTPRRRFVSVDLVFTFSSSSILCRLPKNRLFIYVWTSKSWMIHRYSVMTWRMFLFDQTVFSFIYLRCILGTCVFLNKVYLSELILKPIQAEWYIYIYNFILKWIF